VSGVHNPASQSLIISFATLSLSLVLFIAAAPEISELGEGWTAAAQNSNSSQTPIKPRRPLPKPPSGPRGFEKYLGSDTSARQIAGGATRATVNPRRPVAPLEGRAYEARPFLAWEIAPGSKTYHFVLYDGDFDKNHGVPIVYQTDVTATELIYPIDAPRLTPGKLYSWRVSTPTAMGKEDGGVARFVILSGPEAEEVKQALAAAGLSMPKTPADRLDQARVFENYGIWYDALRIASELAENPNDKEALVFYEALLEKLESQD
jgi:uncharacterized protein DUF928